MVVEVGGRQPEPRSWMTEERVGDEVWLRMGQAGRGIAIQFPGYADFTVDIADAHVCCCAAPGTQPETVRHLLLDQILPRMMASRGHLVLHASAVLLDGRAVALCGPSGAGKSTLAARLGVAGVPVLADDAVLIEPSPAGLLAVPAYPGLRLSPDLVATLGAAAEAHPVSEYTAKLRVAHTDRVCFADVPARLGAVALLRRGAHDVAARRLRGASAFDAALRVQFMPLGARRVDRRMFTSMVELANTVPFVVLDVPDEADSGSVFEAIRGEWAEGPSGPTERGAEGPSDPTERGES